MSIVFFTDRDLGKQFPNLLLQAGLTIEKHADHFADIAKDEEWLTEVGRRGWYAITHDQRIRYKPNEKAAVMQAGVGLLILIGTAPFAELATNFIVTLPKIEQFIQTKFSPIYCENLSSDRESQNDQSLSSRAHRTVGGLETEWI